MRAADGFVIWFRRRVTVNTDPQRRCYWGVHARSEEQWTDWGVREEWPTAEVARRRATFWRQLNEYAVSERGASARQQIEVHPVGVHPAR